MDSLSNNAIPPTTTHTPPDNRELDFSGWQHLSLNAKRSLVIQAETGNGLGDRLKTLSDRIIENTTKLENLFSSGSESAIEEVNILWKEINLVRDEQYALQLQLEDLSYHFDKKDTLFIINSHIKKELKTIDREFSSLRTNNKDQGDSVLNKKPQRLWTLLKKTHIQLPQTLYDKANNIGQSITEKIPLSNTRTKKESVNSDSHPTGGLNADPEEGRALEERKILERDREIEHNIHKETQV